MDPSPPRSPALPWAAPASTEAEAAGAAGPAPLLLEQVGVTLGSRVEVMWKIDKEDGTSTIRWWGATVASKADNSDEAAPQYALRYDAYEDFEEELVTVAFIGQHLLQSVNSAAGDGHGDDGGDDEQLHWRKEGEAWEPPPGEQEGQQEELAELDDDATYSLQEVLGRLPDERTLQAVEAQALSELEPSQQRHVAEGFRGFIDNFKAFLAAKVESAKESGSENVTITRDAIDDFHAQMRTKRQRTDYGTGSSL